MSRRALLVGIDQYDHAPSLSGCVNDSREMATLLERNEDGTPNYACRVLTSPGPQPVTRKLLRQQWADLFGDFDGDVLFYFSGHGAPTEAGGFLVTQEGEPNDPGLAMNELLALANKSNARSVLLFLDCCFSGDLGNPPDLQSGGNLAKQAQLCEGLTILAASRPTEAAAEVGGHGVFTDLVLGALRGGAADVRGRVSAASIYAYVEQALGPWDQRPLYKSHACRLSPVRQCTAAVPDALLRELPSLFDKSDSLFSMDPSFEVSHESKKEENVGLFGKFKILRNARLLATQEGSDLYRVALDSGTVQLTPLGQFYWRLADLGRV